LTRDAPHDISSQIGDNWHQICSGIGKNLNNTTAAMINGVINCAKTGGINLLVPEELQVLLNQAKHGESPIPIKYVKALFDQITGPLNRPDFPLIFARWLVGKDTSLVGYICENCEYLFESFEMTLRYSRLGSNKSPVLGSADFSMKQVGELTWVEIFYRDKDYELYGSEATIGRIVSSIRATVRDDFPFLEIHFNHPKLSQDQDYKKVFNCPVRFEQSGNRMIFPTLSLKERVRTAQPYIKRILVDYADTFLPDENETPDIVQKIQEILIAELVKGKVTLENVCKKLGVSSSTLQRQLKTLNTNFKLISESTKKELAKQYLKKGLSVTNVTFMLGFSDTSAFNRAFKRWYGVSPSEF